MAKSSKPFSLADLKLLLDSKADQYNQPSFIPADPISIPHYYQNPLDREIVGLIIASISWGNRASILKSGEKLIQILGESPSDFIASVSLKDLNRIQFVHRTFQSVDFQFFIRALKDIYSRYGTLELAFGGKNFCGTVPQRIAHFREIMLQTPHQKRSEKHLPNSESGSACKRINMFLRWMVRKDNQGVDFGIWRSISPAELYLPLDVHTGNVARKLGLLHRKQNDLQALEELMNVLRSMDPADPVRYDYALFGIGVNEKTEPLETLKIRF